MTDQRSGHSLPNQIVLDNQIEIKMSDDIEVCQLHGDLRFINYILPVLPVAGRQTTKD